MKNLDEKIRQRNKDSVSRNKSTKSFRSEMTKSQKRMNYWSSIKDEVSKELKNRKV